MSDQIAYEDTKSDSQDRYPDTKYDVSTGLYDAMRSKYDEYVHLTHDRLGLASTYETQQLKRWIESIDERDTEQIYEAEKWYRLDYQKRAQSALELYHGQFLPPLQRALSQNVISEKSLDEWVKWVRDKGRDYKEKELSISRVLPDYLSKRYTLAGKRQGILRDPRMKALENSTDPRMKALSAKIRDDDFFLDALSFDQRKALIEEVLLALPMHENEIPLFRDLESALDAAMKDELISEDSRKKWIARFKDPSVNHRAKEYFLTQQFPSYVTGWRRVHSARSTLLKDPLMKNLTEKDVKELKTFLDDKKFRALHFDKKEGLNATVKATLTAKKTHKEVLHSETRNVLQAAAAAGYISSDKIGGWALHVLEGKRTLQELKDFIKDWAKVRFRYDKVEHGMVTGKVPQGFSRLSEEQFLKLSYAQRLSYVEEAERRLHIENGNPKDTLIQDAKGKVRHALDLENWEEAEHFLRHAWPLAETQEDIAELQSMEKYLRAFDKKRSGQKETADDHEEIRNANNEIEMVLSLLPPSLQPIYRKALSKGADCLQCVTTTVYNRTWCQERGYLTESLEEKLHDQSIEETAERLSPTGDGHSDGLENNFVDGFHQPSIRDKGIGPQNVFLSSSGADAFVEKAEANKSCWSFWYWTNLIVDGVSAGQNSYVAYSLNHRIKRAARTLEKHGVRYSDPVSRTSRSPSEGSLAIAG